MAERVDLVVNYNVLFQLRDKPLVVLNSRQFVIQTDEKASREGQVAERDFWRMESAVFFHVFDATEIVSKQLALRLDRLGIVDDILVATSCHEVLYEHVVAIQVVHIGIRVGEPAEEIGT